MGLDEYSSSIFMNGINTISSYNICEDSLLATPLMIDMVVLGELFSRMSINDEEGTSFLLLELLLQGPIHQPRRIRDQQFQQIERMLGQPPQSRCWYPARRWNPPCLQILSLYQTVL